MRKQPYSIFDITGGINREKNPVILLDKESPDLRNVRFSEYMLKKDLGLTAYGTLDGIPLLIDTFYLYSGSEFYLFATTKWIYELIDGVFIKRNPSDMNSTSLSLVINGTAKTIVRSTGSFITDGFVAGNTINLSSSVNALSYTIDTVATLTITIVETTLINESATMIVYRQKQLSGVQTIGVNSAITLDNTGADIFFITNGVDEIMYWRGTTRNFSFLTGLIARKLLIYKNRLLLGFVTQGGTSYPKRVAWSVLANPTTFTGVGSGFLELTDTVDWFVTMAVIKDRLYVLKERSLWELAYVAGTTYFKPTIKVDGVGTKSPGATCSLGETWVFVGDDDIYTWDGLSLSNIGGQLVPMLYDTALRILIASKLNIASSIYVEELDEYWLALPCTGPSPILLFKYSFKYKSWAVRDGFNISCFGYNNVKDSDSWNDLIGAWSAQTWVWLAKALPSGAPTTLIGLSDGLIKEDDRVTKTTAVMYFETKDFIFNRSQRWVEFRVEAKGDPFYLSYSIDSGVNWSTQRLVTPDTVEFTTCVLPLNVTSKLIRFKIYTAQEDLEIRWMEPWFIPRQRVKNYVTVT